jgi:DNA-binding transcriptional MerR regulator
LSENITVGKLSKVFGISRSALLYYDKIGLLSPTAKSSSGYRLYSKDDITRLKNIMVFRETGMTLQQIKGMLSVQEDSYTVFLMQRLKQLNDEIFQLRASQKIVLDLLEKTTIAEVYKNTRFSEFIEILRQANIIKPDLEKDEKQMSEWHKNFEKLSPENHRQFLNLLGAVPNLTPK